MGQAVDSIQALAAQLRIPPTVNGSFQGTAQAFQASLSSMPLLVAAAILVVYIVLGILYESYIHPITILSALPSAGVGALVMLMLFGYDLSVIAIIGIILLIGIVKKNAIMMIDFALQAERLDGKSPREAIHEACLLRFRPIMMTTFAALFGALPIALGHGAGSELRRPLGIAIIGGLLVSQWLTLYTTPVIYLYLERFSRWLGRSHRRVAGRRRLVGPAGIATARTSTARNNRGAFLVRETTLPLWEGVGGRGACRFDPSHKGRGNLRISGVGVSSDCGLAPRPVANSQRYVHSRWNRANRGRGRLRALRAAPPRVRGATGGAAR